MTRPTNTATSVPDVSIIIPAFNKLDLTRACLESLAEYTPAGMAEIVVVDNGSTDGSPAYLRAREAAGELRVVAPGENLGFARGCNAGADVARGRHLLFLNNDTVVTPRWLEPLVDTLDRDPAVGAVGALLLFPDGTIQHAGAGVFEGASSDGHVNVVGRHRGYRKSANDPAYQRPRECQVLTAACLMVRREAFAAAGGFDPIYWNGNEDVDLCFRLVQAGWRLVYQPACVVWHFESQSGPERWRQVRHNSEVLTARWRGVIKPEFLAASECKRQIVSTKRRITYALPLARDPRPPRAGAAPTVSIVVLTWNARAYTERCAASLLVHTHPRHELIFVDNGSTDGTPQWLQDLARRENRVRVILNAENRGFAAGNNQGISAARGDHVLLLNNDTVVTPGWLDTLLAALARHPRAGLFGPVTNNISGAQKLARVRYDQPTCTGLDRFAASRAVRFAGRTTPLLCAVGFCLLIRRRVIEEIGGLDEGFGQGNYEDTDYCLRAFLADWRALMVEDSFVHHFGSRSFVAGKIDYATQIESRFAIFKRKWGLPDSVEQGAALPPEVLLADGFLPALHTEPLAAGPRLDPLPWSAWDLERRLVMGEDLFARGRLAQAERHFRSVLASRPEDPRAASDLAVTLWQQGDAGRAVAMLEDVLARHPDHDDARHNLEAIAAVS